MYVFNKEIDSDDSLVMKAARQRGLAAWRPVKHSDAYGRHRDDDRKHPRWIDLN